jgi:hypothetical protein
MIGSDIQASCLERGPLVSNTAVYKKSKKSIINILV